MDVAKIGNFQLRKANLNQITIPILLSFAACIGYAAVNEIAIEMEMPFGFDVNDYPVIPQPLTIGGYFVKSQTSYSVSCAGRPQDANLINFRGN